MLPSAASLIDPTHPVTRAHEHTRPATGDYRVRHLLENASWLFSGNALASLFGFVQAVVLARALGAQGYGLLAFVMAFANTVGQVIDIRLWESVTQFVGDDYARGDHGRARATVKLAYLIDAATGLLAFALVAAVAPIAAPRFVPDPQAAAYLVLYAGTLLVATVNDTSMALLRVFDRFRILGAERAASAAIRLLALWAAVAMTGSLFWVLGVYVVVELARGLVLLAWGLRAARASLTGPGADHLGVLRERVGEFWRFSLSNAGTSVLASASRHIDILILTALHTPREVGLYRMAKNFDVFIHRLADPVHHAMYPELVRLGAAAPETTRVLIAHTMRVVLALVVPAGLLVILCARPLLDRLVGPEFTGAVLPLRILVAGSLIQVAFLWARPLALAIGRPHLSTLAHAAGVVILIAVSFILVPRGGATGSAIAFLLMSAVVGALTAIVALRAAARPRATDRPPDHRALSLPGEMDTE